MASRKKELILVAGVLLVMIGLLPFMPLIYAVIISVGIYAAVKALAGRREKTIRKEIPEGMCVDCGSKIVGGICPNCSEPDKEK